MRQHQRIKEADKRATKQRRETLEERVHRHINDINSKITDDDIRNVKTELELRSENPSNPPINNEKKTGRKKSSKNQKNENGKGENPTNTNSWDMLTKGD